MAGGVPVDRSASAEQVVEITFLEAVLRRLPGHVSILRSLADLYTEVGRFEDGHRLDQCLVACEDDADAWYNLACSQALCGQSELAIDSLGKAIQRGFDDAAWMKKDPDLACLRPLAAFQDLVRSLR